MEPAECAKNLVHIDRVVIRFSALARGGRGTLSVGPKENPNGADWPTPILGRRPVGLEMQLTNAYAKL